MALTLPSLAFVQTMWLLRILSSHGRSAITGHSPRHGFSTYLWGRGDRSPSLWYVSTSSLLKLRGDVTLSRPRHRRPLLLLKESGRRPGDTRIILVVMRIGLIFTAILDFVHCADVMCRLWHCPVRACVLQDIWREIVPSWYRFLGLLIIPSTVPSNI